MTRDEILNMPAGIEMDKAIGDYVFVLTVDPIRCPYCGEEMWMGKTRSRCSNCNRWRYSPYKEYSSGIEEAWEVVEKLDRMWAITRLPSENIYQAAFIDRAPLLEVAADTAPLAICRLALLFVLEKAGAS